MRSLPDLGPRGEGWVALQVVGFALVAGAGLLLPGAAGDPLATLVPALGGLLIWAGGALALWGLGGLQEANALTAVPHPRAGARLVDSGAYRLVRHPIYGGLILGALGWAMVRLSLPALLAAVYLVAVFELKRRREEAWLMERYPTYAAYRHRTRALIPFLY
jgi:protein-S-isoprenylcysteine O-methyltransferase Ste14